MPPRSLTYTTVAPVFGFQLGDVLAPLAKVSRLGEPPLASETKISGLPSIDDSNMSFEPSGDQAGELFVPLNRGKVMTLLASTEYMQIWGPTRPWYGAKQVNAMRERSGDQRGVSEIVLSDVSGC